MTTMYQTVDDPHAVEAEANDERAARRKALVWVIAAAILILIGAALYSHYQQGRTPETDIASRAERASYRTALAEGEIDLRRARLRDFETTYPQSEFLPAARAQLSVMDAYETRAWAALYDVMYDPSAQRLDKLAAIDLYEALWGSTYLGGRDSDINTLRQQLETVEEAAPDRELKPGKSSIPASIPDGVMAGGPRRITAPPPVRIVRPAPAPAARSAVIVPPVIRKNVKPRYPRKARRKGLGARVVLSLSIDDKGEVRLAEVISVQAERYAKDFVKASERAAMRTRYIPQIVDGKAVPVSGIKKIYLFRVEN